MGGGGALEWKVVRGCLLPNKYALLFKCALKNCWKFRQVPDPECHNEDDSLQMSLDRGSKGDQPTGFRVYQNPKPYAVHMAGGWGDRGVGA